MSAVAEREDLHVEVNGVGFDLEHQTLRLPAEISYDDYAKIGVGLGRFHRMSPLAIGDWVNHGETYLPETYLAAQDLLEQEPETVMKYARVARQVPSDIRQSGLRFTHYAIVAPIKSKAEKRKLLERCAKNRWSEKDLRVALNGAKPDSEPSKSEQIHQILSDMWSASVPEERDGQPGYWVPAYIVRDGAKLAGVYPEDIDHDQEEDDGGGD